MNHYYHPNHHNHESYDDETRQFNPAWWLLNQMIGPTQGPGFPPPGQSPGFPGGGGFPGGPSQPGPGSGQQAGPPTSPPPNFTPQQSQVQTFAVDPGGIRRCLFRFTYIWLRRDAFWFYPTFVGRRSIAGYRWTGWNWVYFGIDLDHIQQFQCV